MSITGQVFKDVLRLCNGFSDTDDPFMLIECCFELLVGLGNIQFPPADSPVEGVDKFTAKYQGEGFLIKQIGMVAGDPLLGFRTHSAAGNKAVEMKMAFKLLIPGMQYSHKTEFSPKLVFAKGKERFSDGFKQNREDQGFVFQDEGIQFMGQGKDDMEVCTRQQF